MSKPIGFLVATDSTSWRKYIDAFEKKLQRLNWNKVAAPTANPRDVVINYQ